MCGRYALVNGKKVFLTWSKMRQLEKAGIPFEILPRYNASPMQKLPVVAIRDNELTVQPMQWWLIPHWAAENKPQFSAFNAMSEKLEASRMWNTYFKGSRCLVPADAFYEWKKIPTEKEVKGKKKEVVEKHPMCIRMKDEAPFMFAGLFSVWVNKKTGEEFPTFAIITTTPNELMEDIHNRMPVILDEKDFEQWLDREYKDTAKLKKLLVPYPAKKMKAYPVSTIVSNSRNDVPECLEPIKEEKTIRLRKKEDARH
jgi:putative SOS response-associated peptidase YedK